MSAPPSAAIGNLLQPPSINDAQQTAITTLSAKLGNNPVGSKLNPTLTDLVAQAQAGAVAPAQLAQSSQQVQDLLANTRAQLATVQDRTTTLKTNHDLLEDRLIDHHELLVSSLSQREHQDPNQATLRERLDTLSTTRKELQLAREWFQILAKAEELG